MKSLYFFLDFFTILIPLCYSILERDFHFIKHARSTFGAISVVGVIFLIWDAIFTAQGVWGFNPSYYLGFTILKMPIEEWLFFICVPYACLFSHEALKYYVKGWGLNQSFSQKLTFFFAILLFVVALFNLDKAYTSINYLFCSFLLIVGLKYFPDELAKYYPSFLIIMVPFAIVNGILTGSFIPEEVVWYNNEENLGIRLGTIPIEDVAYAFSMLFGVQMLFNYFRSSYTKQGNPGKN